MPESMIRNDIDETYMPDGTVVSVPVARASRDTWEPLQIKALFTPDEWLLARTVVPDIFEALTLTFNPIPTDAVIENLRLLVPSVLTGARFTEMTGRGI